MLTISIISALRYAYNIPKIRKSLVTVMTSLQYQTRQLAFTIVKIQRQIFSGARLGNFSAQITAHFNKDIFFSFGCINFCKTYGILEKEVELR